MQSHEINTDNNVLNNDSERQPEFDVVPHISCNQESAVTDNTSNVDKNSISKFKLCL